MLSKLAGGHTQEAHYMCAKDLTIREMYASISDPRVVIELFEKGLATNNDRLAVSAMEELIRRGDTDCIDEGLNRAFDYNRMGEFSDMIQAHIDRF